MSVPSVRGALELTAVGFALVATYQCMSSHPPEVSSTVYTETQRIIQQPYVERTMQLEHQQSAHHVCCCKCLFQLCRYLISCHRHRTSCTGIRSYNVVQTTSLEETASISKVSAAYAAGPACHVRIDTFSIDPRTTQMHWLRRFAASRLTRGPRWGKAYAKWVSCVSCRRCLPRQLA